MRGEHVLKFAGHVRSLHPIRKIVSLVLREVVSIYAVPTTSRRALSALLTADQLSGRVSRFPACCVWVGPNLNRTALRYRRWMGRGQDNGFWSKEAHKSY